LVPEHDSSKNKEKFLTAEERAFSFSRSFWALGKAPREDVYSFRSNQKERIENAKN